MIPCPHCGGKKSKVLATRSAGPFLQRRRECQSIGCMKRYYTYEVTERLSKTVMRHADQAKKHSERRSDLHRRNLEIVRRRRAGEKLSVIANDFDMPDTTVSAVIRKMAPELMQSTRGRRPSAAAG
jgi:transcriptional regulator NrdR family protein